MKIYCYPNPHVHDTDPNYIGMVPFSKFHMDLFTLSSPEEADILYMGQFGDSNQIDLSQFSLLKTQREKHWADIEGDWLGREIPPELDGINITINGAVRGIEKRFRTVFVRPTFSTYFTTHLNMEPTPLPTYKSFCFKGYPDPYGLRYRLKDIIVKFPNEYILTDKWNGPAQLGGLEHQTYEKMMLQHVFHLCPRGAGHDSVRFFESCLMGRIPIVIGDNILFGELDGIDTTFAFQISQYLPNTLIQKRLDEIFKISRIEIEDRCGRAREYCKHIRDYFEHPTKYLMKVINGLSIR
jgi:hypothetical protein